MNDEACNCSHCVAGRAMEALGVSDPEMELTHQLIDMMKAAKSIRTLAEYLKLNIDRPELVAIREEVMASFNPVVVHLTKDQVAVEEQGTVH